MEIEETAHELYLKGFDSDQYFDLYHDVDKIKYFEISASKGYIPAMMQLVFIYSEMNDRESQKKYLLMAANKNTEYFYDVAFYFKNIEKNNELAVEYCLKCMENDNKNIKAIYFLANHYFSVEEYDLMKKYCVLGGEIGSVGIFDLLNEYYTLNHNDYSFIEFYKYSSPQIDNLVNRMKDTMVLPKQYYPLFCQLDLIKNDKISQKVIKKQYILQKTNIWPLNYSEKYMIQFMELLSLHQSIFPKDILMLIAGYLFI